MSEMFNSNASEKGILQAMKIKLKAATRLKISIERQIFKLNNAERSLCEELYSTRTEIEMLTEQLEDLKDKLSTTSFLVSKLEIQKVAEESTIETNINNLKLHKQGFDSMLSEERNISQVRNKILEEREAQKQEILRKKQEEIIKKNEIQTAKTAAIEEECENIEKECAVLKKRNKAIMLKIRRKLIETEETRRELINRTQAQDSSGIQGPE